MSSTGDDGVSERDESPSQSLAVFDYLLLILMEHWGSGWGGREGGRDGGGEGRRGQTVTAGRMYCGLCTCFRATVIPAIMLLCGPPCRPAASVLFSRSHITFFPRLSTLLTRLLQIIPALGPCKVL